MTNPSKLPTDQALASELDGQLNVRELFHYALGMLMVEDGKAAITETEHVDGLVFRRIRAKHSTPIIMLTARGGIVPRGADTQTKPRLSRAIESNFRYHSPKTKTSAAKKNGAGVKYN